MPRPVKSNHFPPEPYLAPVIQEPPSRPSSAFEDFTLFDVPDSRPSSGLFASTPSTPRSAMGTRPPTLTEILLDVAPPPWTLSAFMAYLSSNHCMESLEFTLDLQRYAAIYDQILTDHPASLESNQQLGHLWDKLINVYVAPCSPREINIPSPVRDRLLRIPSRPEPPHPSALEEAGRIIHELMNDSLLVPFLESVSPLHLDTSSGQQQQHHHHHHHQGNSTNFPPYLSVDHAASSSRSGSTHAFDFEGLTDDSDGYSPPPMEPMTPPTTPPTSTEWGYPNSPGGFQRAMAAQKEGWKKFGAKLGFKGKESTKRPTPPTSSDPNHRHSNPLCGWQAVPVSTTSYPSDRMPSYSSTSIGWEEPHPGQKLSFPVKTGGNEQDTDQYHLGEGGFRDSTVGTHLPARTDPNLLSPTESNSTTVSSLRLGEPIGAPLGPSISPDSLSVISGARSEAHSSLMTSVTLHLDVEIDQSDMMMDLDKRPATQVISPASSGYSDVSSYLEFSSGPEDMNGVMTAANPEPFSHMAPIGDLYGWDAEWDRRATEPTSHIDEGEQQLTGQSASYRQRRRTKNNSLMGRVFSGVAKTPSRFGHHRER